MATRSTTVIVDERLAATYHAAPKTRQKKALSAMRRALQTSSTSKRIIPHLSKRETALFCRINRSLPVDQQGRYDDLRAKQEQGKLTPLEHTELVRYTEKITDLWSDRLQALIALARLRRVSPKRLMRQLVIVPQPYGS